MRTGSLPEVGATDDLAPADQIMEGVDHGLDRLIDQQRQVRCGGAPSVELLEDHCCEVI